MMCQIYRVRKYLRRLLHRRATDLKSLVNGRDKEYLRDDEMERRREKECEESNKRNLVEVNGMRVLKLEVWWEFLKYFKVFGRELF